MRFTLFVLLFLTVDGAYAAGVIDCPPGQADGRRFMQCTRVRDNRVVNCVTNNGGVNIVCEGDKEEAKRRQPTVEEKMRQFRKLMRE